MRSYRYLFILLIIQTFSGFAIEVTQKIEAIQQSAQQLLKELQGLKQCYAAKNCTKAQYDRIKQLGKKIGAAVVVLVGAGILAGLGIRSRKASMKPIVQNAVRRFKVDVNNPSTGFNDLRLLEFVETGKQAHEKARSFITGVQERFSIQGLEAVQWIADEKRDRAMYNFATKLIEKKKSERIKQEAILRGEFIEKAEPIFGTQPISGG